MALSACVLYRCADAAAATAATGARHRRHATVSSASLRSSWWGRAIGHVGAHRFDAAIVSIAAPTGTVARKRRRRPDGHGSKEASAHCKATAGRAAAARSVLLLGTPQGASPSGRMYPSKFMCLYSEIYVRKSDLRRRTRNAQ